ncbi:MAG: NAD(+) synthase [Christensenellaceae bacterium]|nr:NAD(+) synthase [Christensenellaceae bacterium]
MKNGFLKVAAVSPKIRLADPKYNADLIIDAIKQADEKGVRLVAFPELVMTGYTCGDLFMHELLLNTVVSELKRIAEETKECKLVSIIGAPICVKDKLYNCAVVVCRGQFICAVPKIHLPNYGEFYEKRHFASGKYIDDDEIWCDELLCHVEPKLVIRSSEIPNFRFGVEICEDLWVSDPPSNAMTEDGALIIVNCSAGDETIGKADYRKNLVAVQSAKTCSAYIYCGAGEGESTSDMVFSGHSFIYENGVLLAENKPFESGMLITEIDLDRLCYERRLMNSFSQDLHDKKFLLTEFKIFGEYDRKRDDDSVVQRMELPITELTRKFDRNPFVPHDEDEINARAHDILMLQAMGLKRRLEHTHSKCVVFGISGGLDSSLALLACVKTCDIMGMDRSFIHAVTMPCFGTTHHTKNNAVELCNALGVTLHTIPISDSVRQHFSDIGHDENDHSIVYENAQARMRTLVLMDLANSMGGLVIGTGDLSELALGWATYNGDHMSMYGINSGIPKTLIKYVVRYYAKTCGDERIKNVLFSILDTPISPELLPADEDGHIAQRTEDLVGPYELHDFFLYYVLRWGYPPAKLYRIAKSAFGGSEFTDEVILKWLKNFYRRFFNQQFKRNCLPDGPKVGSVCLSPRGDWRMPSDASCRIWFDELEALE